ncbi:MAG: aminoacyl-tRNA hydrolase [Candidatus Magasanikbacteria bacterium]|nr:aminoacyl-tRNA hydrolase [Candidatus Magasanikbacteria bacterium]
MKLIIGLGNPEKEYTDTRHNAGFLILEKLLATFEFADWNFDKKSNALISKGKINKKRTALAMPQTYMNNSGVAVQALLNFYKLKPENLIVIHDDKDIPLGETRIQTNRGPAGHNGIKSIIEHLGTQNFTRIRVGVAPKEQEKIKDTAGFVLGKFTAAEKKILDTVAKNIIKEIETLI